MLGIRPSVAALSCLLCLGCGSGEPDALDERLTAYIEHQLADKDLPAFSIVLVDDQEIVYSRGFGLEREGIPASPESVYRVGSISKLYTDIALMQLVEQGRIDLDDAVTKYLPEFRPRGDGAQTITLRHLTSHRAGIVREPPVGSYFDDSEPQISEIVASLADTDLVYPVGSRQRYSNAGVVVIGAVIEAAAGRPFAEHVETAVLRPLGMRSASFRRTPEIEPHITDALMWSYDGRTFPAPTFDVLVPAGNLYSNMLDQAQLLRALARGGAPVLEPETLRAMMEPQIDAAGRFGVGFALSQFDGRRAAGHSGAVYGFASDLRYLPDDKIGVASSAARDVVNDVVRRINDYALRLLLARKAGSEPPHWEPSQPVDEAIRRRAAGTYRSAEQTIRLLDRGGELWIEGVPHPRARIRRAGERFELDDLEVSGETVELSANAVVLGEQSYERFEPSLAPEPPEPWRELIGEYGPDHNILFVLERYGQLCALIEWTALYPLTEVDADRFAFPDYGLYHGERIAFERDAAGVVTAAIAAGIRFNRRPSADAGETFHIEPLQPVEALRAVALTAEPPAQSDDLLAPDLIDLTALDPTIRLDIRYASTNNFMRAQFYPEPRALLQRPAAEALVRAHRRLAEQGYGLLIHDAYRPWYVTKMFFDATPESMKGFVADPATGSIHNRGAAVDLTLYDLATGLAARMPSGYDEFSERAYPGYLGGTQRERDLRDLLRATMEAEGFSVYETEWWHFNHRDAARYPVLNTPHADIAP